MQQENGFLSLLFNIIIPVLILNKLNTYLGPQWTVILALSLPVGYGIWSYLKTRSMNPLSLLGMLNVGITGGLALRGLEGIWFAWKEAAFPGLIGIFVLVSAWTKKPFFQTFVLNPAMIQTDRMMEIIKGRQLEFKFSQLLKTATVGLAASFFLSAILNFVVALRIFTPIDPLLGADERATILNGQIAEMTSLSFVVIALPSTVILVGILFWSLKRLEALTGESWQSFLKS